MSNTWFRLYNEVVDDPKVQCLHPTMFRAWINCLCIAAKNDGQLPEMDHIAYTLRVTAVRAEAMVNNLVNAGLFEWRNGACLPHNWNGRQFQSDRSTARVHRFRERQKEQQRNVSSPVSETHQNRTDTEQSRTDKPQRVRQPKTAPPNLMEITDEMYTWAIQTGLPTSGQVMIETTKMLDHFRGKGERKSDWLATWRNWIRNAVQYRSANGQKQESREQAKVRRNLEAAGFAAPEVHGDFSSGLGSGDYTGESNALPEATIRPRRIPDQTGL